MLKLGAVSAFMNNETAQFPWRRNVIAIFLLTVILYSGYQLSNCFHITEPFYLPLTALDCAIPFSLWSVWPYFLLVLLAFLPLSIRNATLFWRTMIAFTVAVSINIGIWILFPTIYPRPITPEGNGLTIFAYNWLCSIDTPANCLPSGHITSPAIGCWAMSKAYPKFRVFIWSIFSLLSITILTTKQHYVFDLPGGLLTGFIGIWSSNFLYHKIMTQQSSNTI